MKIISLITKRSCRETDPLRQKKLFFSNHQLVVGDVIEIIDGNKKSPAYIVNIEGAAVYKQAIRSGELELSNIKFSKTGEYAQGVTITSYNKDLFVSYLKNPNLAHETDDPFLKDFFPKKRKKKAVAKKTIKKADSFSSLSVDKYFGNKKEHHSEMHELVDTIRKYFGETARYGQGSFSYYLGFFKKIPNYMIQQMFEEAKRSPKGIDGQRKIFWWKVGQYVKSK